MSLFEPFSQFIEADAQMQIAQPLEWRLVGDDLFLRPRGADVQIVWAYLIKRDFGKRLENPARRRAALKKLGKVLNAHQLWRYWPLENGELFLRSTWGLMRVPNAPAMLRFELPARFESAQATLRASAEQVAELVVLARHTEDYARGSAWLHAYRDAWDCVAFERGSRAQLERLLRGFWALFDAPGDAADGWRFWDTKTPESATVRWSRPYVMPYDLEKQARIDRMFNVLSREIVLKVVDVAAYDKRAKPTALRCPNVLVPTQFSAHERLEGVLAWRDFLNQHLPPDEVEQLLSPT